MNVMAQDDRALVEALRRGDRTGLEGIYRRYADRLYTYARTMLHEPEAAADAVHDAFLTAGQRIDQLRDPDRLRSWLYAIVRNECLRQLRERARSAPLSEAAEPVADTGDPAAAVNADQVRALVHLAVDALNPGDREVVHLAIRHDLSSADIGTALGVPANHAHARLSRARSQLERALGTLLVARSGARDCPTLAELLGDWQGRLTPVLRKRLARHIDDCARCGLLRREQCNPAALLTAYTAPGFLVVAETVWSRLAEAGPTAVRATAELPAAADPPGSTVGGDAPDVTAAHSSAGPTRPAGTEPTGPTSPAGPTLPADPVPAAGPTPPVPGSPPESGGVAGRSDAAGRGGPDPARDAVAPAGAAATRAATRTVDVAARDRDRRRRRRVAVTAGLLLLLVVAGTWAVSAARPDAEQVSVTAGVPTGAAVTSSAVATAAPSARTTPGPDASGAGGPAVPGGSPADAATDVVPGPTPAPSRPPTAPRPTTGTQLAAPFTVSANAHVRCGADAYSLVVRATGSGALVSAQVRYTPAGGVPTSRAMTVDGSSARVTVGQLRASAVTWTVRVTAVDGRTAQSPSSTVADPCVRPG
ncbi:RNA polymerase sigma factor [Micromonospora sp. HUAS LYJ1]|uniref:RNA polymerase sigma factor n=1 Tax=Micromonospora sp. HUAS LYJ1 TaxID=3061626 RepID=UPI002672FAAC|nr:sigma-70 family RNA polymerase sigma factor [Micromonospora sp. HUAS LYJ1]WKU02910.1 sigma-70 family RNA polymerase sigma factor [Micromonospora sp. HUAS LYJ1]